MSRLFVTYSDKESGEQRIPIEGERFTIGRHSGNDLPISDSRLSRHHLRIERFADVYVVSDLGSSNGTKLNGEELTEPKAMAAGDVLDLGGVQLAIESDEPQAAKAEPEEEPEAEPAGAARPSSVSASADETEGSFLGKFLIVIPILGLLMILVLGGGVLIYRLVAGESDDTSDRRYPTPYDDIPYETPEATASPSPGDTGAVPSQSPPGGSTPEPTQPSSDLSEEEKLRNLVTSFMREIAQRDPNPVITSEPLTLIKSRVDRFRGSAAVASNIENAARSKAQIEALARSKNLRAELVAVAALTRLGSNRGDVLATANGMIDVLSKLKTQIGDAFANECIIIVAVYDQGEKGQFLQMRDMMTRLSTDYPNISSRKVRTVWFLKEQGKLTDAQFDLALRFLALGAIANDPAAFGIQAPKLEFR